MNEPMHEGDATMNGAATEGAIAGENISLRNITMAYGRDAAPVLDDVDVDVAAGEFVTILGPSGCGKTTLLRVIGGLATPDSGSLLIDGAPVEGPGVDRAIVFQSFALLPWADVLTNVAFGLEVNGVSKRDREEIAAEYVRLVGLSGFERHLPKQLSGGMQQRVGLARALAVEPKTLLMDEPFGALDEQTRRILQEQLLEIWEATGKTVVFITHSLDEAIFLADRVLLMQAKPGRVAKALDVPFGRPRNRDVEGCAEFIDMKAELWQELRLMHEERVR